MSLLVKTLQLIHHDLMNVFVVHLVPVSLYLILEDIGKRLGT